MRTDPFADGIGWDTTIEENLDGENYLTIESTINGTGTGAAVSIAIDAVPLVVAAMMELWADEESERRDQED